ncbi:MAG: hypothetical protein GF388_00655 [Candidatus Aegiribacteria sp.]|nr:hypothetical protein [Candidatus Aegiribacteria sp.]
MKKVTLLVLVIAMSLFAGARTGAGGTNPSGPYRGTITLEEMFPVGLTGSYGLSIKDNVANSIWISNWGDLINIEFDMTTGSQTGTTWDITNGIDPDDSGYGMYGGTGQWFFGDWTFSNIGVFEEGGTYLKSIAGPGGGWTTVTGVAPAPDHDMLYCSDFHPGEIAWGSYTGTESSVTWTTETFASVSGMSVWGDYIFMCCQITGADNIFIFEINGDGSINMTPVWSAEFVLEDMSGAGGIDYDGTYLWLYPQNTSLYKLSIDFDPGALENATWGQIKASL